MTMRPMNEKKKSVRYKSPLVSDQAVEIQSQNQKSEISSKKSKSHKSSTKSNEWHRLTGVKDTSPSAYGSSVKGSIEVGRKDKPSLF
jgi:hypothetical protein